MVQKKQYTNNLFKMFINKQRSKREIQGKLLEKIQKKIQENIQINRQVNRQSKILRKIQTNLINNKKIPIKKIQSKKIHPKKISLKKINIVNTLHYSKLKAIPYTKVLYSNTQNNKEKKEKIYLKEQIKKYTTIISKR